MLRTMRRAPHSPSRDLTRLWLSFNRDIARFHPGRAGLIIRCIALITIGVSGQSFGQVSLTTTNYSQNFDSLGSAAATQVIFTENFNSITATSNGGNILTERRNGNFLGNLTIPGWTTEGTSTQLYALDTSGDKAMWLNEGGTSSNGIFRTISGLLPGAVHTLSFEYWGDNASAGTPYSFTYEINGITTAISTTTSGTSTGKFQTVSFAFTPTGTTTTLRFLETTVSPSGASPLLDNIMITATPVPEPSTVIAGALALAALGWQQRHRFRRLRGKQA